MSDRLTETNGEAQLMLWPGDSPVSMCLQRDAGRGLGQRTHQRAADSGTRCDESSPSADPVGCSLRTSLLSELAGLTSFSLTWKRSATPLGRSWWVLGRSARHIDEIGCGLSLAEYQTPTTQPERQNSYPSDPSRKRPSLADQAAWPTPVASPNANRNTGSCPSHGVTHGHTLSGVVHDLAKSGPTPTRKDGDNDTLPPSQMDWDSTVGAVMRGLRDQDKSSTSGKPLASSVLNARWVAQLMGYPSNWCDLPADTTASLFARTGMQSSPPSSRPSAAGS